MQCIMVRMSAAKGVILLRDIDMAKKKTVTTFEGDQEPNMFHGDIVGIDVDGRPVDIITGNPELESSRPKIELDPQYARKMSCDRSYKRSE